MDRATLIQQVLIGLLHHLFQNIAPTYDDQGGRVHPDLKRSLLDSTADFGASLSELGTAPNARLTEFTERVLRYIGKCLKSTHQ